MTARVPRPAEELAERLGAPRRELDARRLVPMLCERDVSHGRVLAQSGFVFELKLDGVRILADKQGDNVRLGYRKLRDATQSYAEIAEAVRGLPEDRVVLDGEIVAFDENGHPSFDRLAHRIQAKPYSRAATTVPVVYVVFDVLAIGAFDVRALPIEARKQILELIVPESGTSGGLLRLHPTFREGDALFRLCRENSLEGVVAKRLGSPYRAGDRTLDWIKIKTERDVDLVVCAWNAGEGRRSRLGAMDLAAYENGRFVTRGRVGSGLDEDTIDLLLERFASLEERAPTAEETPAMALVRRRDAVRKKRHHVRPEIVVSIRYGGVTADGQLRFPVFRGLRPDMSPEDCVLPIDIAEPLPGPPSREDELHRYFDRVAPRLFAEVLGRPCALLRPDPRNPDRGTRLWPPPRGTPSSVRTAAVIVGESVHRGYLVDSRDVLAFAVDAGCVEIAHGAVRTDAPGLADFVALRVSAPSGGALARAALVVRDLAADIGLPARAKTAGPGAIDVLLGVGDAAFEAALAFGPLLARLASDHPSAKGATVAARDDVSAVWSPLLASGGDALCASVPVAWEEIATLGAGFDLDAAARRCERDHERGEVSLREAIGGAVDVGETVALLERRIRMIADVGK